MKFILVFILSAFVLFGNELFSKLDKLIKTKREKNVVFLKYDPFIYPKKNIEKGLENKGENKVLPSTKNSKKSLDLVTIINSKAFINGRWYSKGDVIDKYIIKSIHKNSVVLKKGQKSMVLDLVDSKKIVKVREN